MTTYQECIEKPPVVFISYCWSSDEHVKKVLELAKRLSSDGIDVRIDKWSLKEGQDKYNFMESMVKDDSIDKVLIICDRCYSEKANDRKGGVGTETQIITPKIFNNVEETKFLAIIFERDQNGNEYLPVYLASRIFIDLSIQGNYEEEYIHLLRVIFNRPENEKPLLGTPPTFIFNDKATSITKTVSKINQFKTLILQGNRYAIGAFEDYLESLFNILDNDFRLEPPKDNSVFFDDIIIQSINSFIPYRDEFINLLSFLSKYRMDKEYFESIRTFFSKILNLFSTNEAPTILDNYRFISWELFLYSIALLIHSRRIIEYKILIDNPYFLETQYSKGLSTYTIFRQYIRSLDEFRKNRLNLNLLSVAVNELQQRGNSIVPFNLVIQADLILYIRSISLPEHDIWFPSTLIYNRGNKSEFFTKAEYKVEFVQLLQFLNCANKEELLSSLNDDLTFRNGYFIWAHLEVGELTNFSKLGTKQQ